LAGLLVWSKQEGTVYWCFLLAAVLVVSALRKELKPAVIWATPGILIWSAWHVFLMMLGTPLSQDFLPLSVANVTSNLGRIPNLMSMLVTELLTWERWGVLWPAVLIVFLVPGRATFMSRVGIIWFVVCPIAAWTLLYILSAWVPYTDLVRASLPRLLLQVVPTSLFLVAMRVQGLSKAAHEQSSWDPTRVTSAERIAA
jgi:hypothetical protein